MTTVFLTTTGAQTWTIPAGVTSIQIEGIGGGGNGITPDGYGGAGAGYAKSSITVTPGQTLYCNVGAATADTWAQISVNAAPTLSSAGIVAKGGPSSTSGGPGTAASSGGVGSVINYGGSGGSAVNASSGGGGAGGPNGAGKAGGSQNSGNDGSSGGGGANGGSSTIGGSNTSLHDGGAGGLGTAGTGAGTGGVFASQNGTDGTNGGGGGGAFGGTSTGTSGGNGGSDTSLGGGKGSGGGGGGSGSIAATSTTGGNGGLYGGGGGGANGTAGLGAQGIIAITYTASVTSSPRPAGGPYLTLRAPSLLPLQQHGSVRPTYPDATPQRLAFYRQPPDLFKRNATLDTNQPDLPQPPSQKRVFITSGTSYTLPADFNPNSNKIECYGAGANGVSNTFGGGAGAYASVSNIQISPNASITINVGVVGGTTDTWFNATSLANAVSNGTTVSCGAQGASGTNGGLNANGCGTTLFAGGWGGNTAGGGTTGGTGGGGAGGPMGGGQNGGSNAAAVGFGGGGGAANGGFTGANATGSIGGSGGNNRNSVGGGIGATGAGGAGSKGGGGGGGTSGGNGSLDDVYNNGINGPGSGGGGGNTTSNAGGNAGGFGGGGGGGLTVGSGTGGLIVVTYTVVGPSILSSLSWRPQLPDLLRHAQPMDTNQWTLPFAGLQRFDTPDALWWRQPPDLFKRNATLDTNQNDVPQPPIPATPTAILWKQPPDLFKRNATLDTNQSDLPQPPTPLTPSPDAAWWRQPPDLLRKPYPMDTNQQEPQLAFAGIPIGPPPQNETSFYWWAQPLGLQRNLPAIDTNQPEAPFAALNIFDTPDVMWWAQPPNLLAHARHLDTNQLTLPFAASNTLSPPAARWWSQPPDLLRHPARLDTNQFTLPFAALQRFDTPDALWWSQPPNLLRHAPELWANEPHLPPLPGFPRLTPVSLGFWTQAPDFFRHAPPLDTKQGFDYAYDIWSRAPAITPGIYWWMQPPDLLRHARYIDTNEFTKPLPYVQAPWTPADLGSALVAWHKADAGLTLSGSTVTGWADQSGNGVDLVGGTTNPTYRATGFNGLPTVSFNESVTTDSLISGIFSLPNAKEVSCFLIGKYISGSTYTRMASIYLSGSNDYDNSSSAALIIRDTTDALGTFFSNTLYVSTPVTPSTNYRIGVVLDGNSMAISFYLNGVQQGASGSLSQTPTFSSARYYCGALTCMISEIVLVNRVLSSTEITQLDNYLNTKWSPSPAQPQSLMWWSQPPDLARHPPRLWPSLTQKSLRSLVVPPPLWTDRYGGGIAFDPISSTPISSGDISLWTDRYGGGISFDPISSTPISSGGLTTFAFTPLEWWWSQPPDLFHHSPHLDTNQARLVAQQWATSTAQWWTQPPDLLRHQPRIDTNQPITRQWTLPGYFWWAQPPDLLHRLPPLDTNQARLVAQQWATPGAWWWAQPPDLLRHASPLDTNQWKLPFAALSRFATSSAQWWAQPPDLLRHATALDTNQWTLPFAGLQRFDTPDVMWWTQPLDLLRHPARLDTNQFTLPYPGHIFDAPQALWWLQPPDLLRHPAHLDTNQGLDLWYVPIALAAVATPSAFWWSQPPDLLRHPPSLATATPRQTTWFNATAAELASAWWDQPPDLLRHPAHLDTNQSRLVSQQFAIPGIWRWSQPPDLLRHPPGLDTNQGADYFFDIWSRAPAVTPSAYWWSQPPDLLRHPAHLDTNQAFDYAFDIWSRAPAGIPWWSQSPDLFRHPPHLDTNQPWLTVPPVARMWWAQPPFLSLRPPTLLSLEPYVAPGWAFRGAGPFIAPPPLNRPVALTQPPGLALLLRSTLPPVFTPSLYWWSQPPDLLRHVPGLWTWQNHIGLLPPRYFFRGSAYILERAPLSFPISAVRRTTLERMLLSASVSAPRKTVAPRVVSGLTATNTIMQGYRRMSRAPDLCPPIVANVEEEYVRFDFAPGLPQGVIVSAIVAVNCYSLDGTDQTPMARILDTPAIIASPTSNLSNQAVVALFGQMIAGLYLVQAIVQTSDGQTLSVEARWPCVNATP